MDQYGSAEHAEEEEQYNVLHPRQGLSGVIPTLVSPALGTHHTYKDNQVPIPPDRVGGHRPSVIAGSNSQRGEIWIIAVFWFLLVL